MYLLLTDIEVVDDINVDPCLETDSSEIESDCKILWPNPTLPCSALLPVALEKYEEHPTGMFLAM